MRTGGQVDAYLQYGIVDKNITEYLKFPKYDNTRYFSLPDDKVKALITEIMNIPDNYYRIMFMFLLRGRRSNEVRSLCWSDIDFENKSYTIQDFNNKTRKNQVYLLDDELIEHLKIIKEKKDYYLNLLKQIRNLQLYQKAYGKGYKIK